MNIISLNGKWTLFYFPQGEMNINNPEELYESNVKSKIKVIDAVVPGNVELDLAKAGELPEDLFFGENIYKLKQYETYEFWYQKEFNLSGDFKNKKTRLVFSGVDCIASYWLNGEEIGHSDNMFIEHEFDISDKLLLDKVNTLTVRLKSPVIEALNKKYEPSVSALQTNWEQLWIRKAPHSYGWDIMPRAISAGLWRSVEIIVHNDNEITDLYFYTISINGKNARLGIDYQIKIDPDIFNKINLRESDKLELRVTGCCGTSAFKSRNRIFFISGNLVIDIEDAKLWWPLGYGEANLYEVTTELIFNEEVIASRIDSVGIRTKELIYEDGLSAGVSPEFLIKINGVPILCKGSNWVPTDAFHSRDIQRYEQILQLFYEQGCNMVRCWGGNVYEDQKFFDLCDKYGIMVWQDFGMACACYPQSEEFLDKIRVEAESVVKKLRNHPSMIIWCGDNECDMAFYNWNHLDPANNRITRQVIPQVLFRLDPYSLYIPSSPYYTPDIIKKKSPRMAPEQHLWGPRDYYKSRFYTESFARFVSEIGYHGCPNLSSLKLFLDEEHLWPWQDNEQWIAHCTDALGKGGKYNYRLDLMANQIKELFGQHVDNLGDFILASQISQAEAMKFFIEMTRINKWQKTGIIWWNMIDGWPQFSDAVVDYYFNKKLAYYYIKRVQTPICIMVSDPDSWNVMVVAGNDSNHDAEGMYKIWDADTGKTLLQGEFLTQANENVRLGTIRVSHGEQRLFLIEWIVNGKKYGNHYLLGHPPFCLSKYKEWLEKISLLQQDFSGKNIGK